MQLMLLLICLKLKKEKITGRTDNKGTKDVELMVPLKYLSNSWRALEMSLTNCEINIDLNWSKECVTVATTIVNQGATFSITDTKIYVSLSIKSINRTTKPIFRLLN